MNILQVCAYAAPYPGNFITSLYELEKKLKEKGYNTIYAFSENARDKDWCKEIEKRSKVYYLPVSKARIHPNTYKIFNKIYSENSIRIMHSHFELYDIPATVTAPKECKVFWHLHDALEQIYSKSNVLHKLLWKLQYSHFSKNVMLLSVSQKHKDFIINLGFDSNKASYLPNAMNLDRIQWNNKLNIQNDFLIFGWDYHRKGVDLAIESIKLLKENDYSCKLGIVGEQETWNNVDLLERGIKENIHKIKPTSDVNILYNQSKCFLHISRAEGLSYALLEAIYAGLPVICSDIKENEFAKEFPTVFFVKIEDKMDIFIKMKKILNNEVKISNESIEKSRNLIEQKYSIKSWCNELLKYYNL